MQRRLWNNWDDLRAVLVCHEDFFPVLKQYILYSVVSSGLSCPTHAAMTKSRHVCLCWNDKGL
jgi:hypothetical protein